LVIGILIEGPAAQAQELQREVFLPAHGRGAIVIVASGAAGTPIYREISSKLAGLGYYTVLMDGNDVFSQFIPSEHGESNLRKSIVDAQAAPQALPGKVALVGLSIGGAGVLLHGAAMHERVSAIVAYYPAINRLPIDEARLAERLRTPVLVLAAGKDEQNNCCRIESMRALALAPKAVSLELVEYPNAGHGFNLHDSRFVYRADDSDDAWARAAAFLIRLHPPSGQ
jgi:dienelactone hydrolase